MNDMAMSLPVASTSMGHHASLPDTHLVGRHSAGAMCCKRVIDFVFAATMLILLLPLLVLIALAVKLGSRGPVLFLQRRTGRGHRPFVVAKFRTMTVQEDGDAVRQATVDDARVTRVGRVLRRTSLDELPQLFNVLTGSMSLVGPRPHALAHDQFYGARIANYGQRFTMRPGLTGLAQVSGLRGEIHELECMERRVAADLDYIRGWSLRRDIRLLCRTLLVVGQDRKAY